MTVKERLAQYGGFVDVAICRHGFAPCMRDYEVVFEAMWGRDRWGDAKGTYRLRLSHCPEVACTTAVPDTGWRQAWSDVFADYAQWLAAGEPDGFVWGVCWATAYPGLSYVDPSAAAERWSQRLGRPMHEVLLETEAYRLRVVFHDFTVTKLSDEVHVIDKVMFPLEPPAG